MNPLTHQLNRIGYLIWNIIFIGVGYLALLARAGGWIDVGKGSGTTGEIIAYIIVLLLTVLYLLVTVRRLQSARLPIVLALLAFVPIAGLLLWLALFFIPERSTTQAEAPNR